MDDLQQYARSMASGARQAALQLAESTGDQRNAWLLRVAELLGTERESLSEANRQDIERASEHGLTDAAVDRLRLTDARIDGMVTALHEVVELPDPVG